MTDDDDQVWEKLARNLVRGELVKRGMSYAALKEALVDLGTEGTIKSKMCRGRFSTVFFLQCMTATGVDRVQQTGAADGSGAFAIRSHNEQALAKKGSAEGEE